MNNTGISHNKKRNVGIVYELLLRSVSSYLVEGEKEKAQVALDIISKRFSKDTELFKEFRLFNALAKTRVTDSAVSAVILTETKAAARRIDHTKLDREKSFLIRDINHTLCDTSFFYRRIGNYRDLATIQVALNEWALGDKSDLSKTILVETKLVEMLRSEPLQAQAPLADSSDAGINSLVIKILNEKFNKKYKGALTEDQRALISDYVMMNVSGGPSTQMIERAQRIKSSAIETLSIIEKTEKNQIIQENLQDVRLRISSLNVSDLNDEKLGRLMTLSQLIEETKESK